MTVALDLSVTLWNPLFDLTENYVQGVSLAPEMLTSMRLVTGTLGDSSRGVGQRLCLILPVRGEGVSTPLLRRTGLINRRWCYNY